MDTNQLQTVLTNVISQNNQQLTAILQSSNTQLSNIFQNASRNNCSFEVPQYREHKDEDVQEWAFALTQRFENIGTIDSKKIPKATEDFREYVLSWYMAHKDKVDQLAQDEFIALLSKTFKPAGHTYKLCQQLEELVCKGNKLAEYMAEFCGLSCHVSDLKKAKIFKFVRGLPERVGQEVVQQAPETVEEAIDIATIFEARRNSIKCVAAHLPVLET